MREQIEALAFEDLEVNMIRFFVYHDLEDPNDNSDPFDLNTSALDWTRYSSTPNNYRSKYVAEALSNAFSLSTYGFDTDNGDDDDGVTIDLRALAHPSSKRNFGSFFNKNILFTKISCPLWYWL